MCGYLVKSFLLVHKKTTIVFKKNTKIAWAGNILLRFFMLGQKKFSDKFLVWVFLTYLCRVLCRVCLFVLRSISTQLKSKVQFEAFLLSCTPTLI